MPEDYLKEDVESVVRHYLGKTDSEVVETIVKGVSRGYDKKKLSERLSKLVKDEIKLIKIVDRSLELKNGSDGDHNRKKRRHGDDHNGDSKRKRKFEETPNSDSKSSDKVKKEAKEETETKEAELTTTPVTPASIKSVLAQAHHLIEEKKKHMNLPPTVVSKKISATDVAAFLSDTVAKQSRADELKARISANLPALLSYQSFTKQEGKPTPLILNSEGKTIDSAGREVSLVHRIPTLKANMRAEKREIFKKAVETVAVEEQEGGEGSSYFDNRVIPDVPVRRRRQFRFHEKGTFEKIAGRLRAKAKLEKLQQEISQAAKKTGISTAVKMAMVAPKTSDMLDEHIPAVEWWDSVILPGETYDVDIPHLEFPAITNLVEHPIQLKPPIEDNGPKFLQVYLTKHERKKLRRQNRKETQREQTEKIRLGLEPPPDPKVKISNLMRVLGNQAIQDPTKMEAHVREQMAKRLKKHEDDNAARKLTPQQKTDKKVKKIKEDISQGVHVAVYRVNDLSSPARKFKVEMNAKQLYMTGCVVLHRDINVVVVEGGPKQQKFFKRLMLNRIKWNEETGSKSRSTEPKEPNKCCLVWEGTVKDRQFGEVKFKACPLEKLAREHFRKHNVEHYWDSAYSGAILEQADDESA